MIPTSLIKEVIEEDQKSLKVVKSILGDLIINLRYVNALEALDTIIGVVPLGTVSKYVQWKERELENKPYTDIILKE